MVILLNSETGQYYIAPSPPSFYQSYPTPSTSTGDTSSSSGSSTVPYDFVGPLQPGVTREEAPAVYSGPIQPGTTTTQKEEFRRTGRISSGGGGGSIQPPTVPYDFVGPLQPGTIREEAPISQQLGQVITPRTNTGDISRGYFGGVNPNIEERGVLAVTKKEARGLQGSAIPYWTIQSETPSEIIREGAFTGSISQINRALNTRSLYEYNIKNIIARQEIYKQYKGTVTKFKTDPKSFEGKPGVTKTKSEGAFVYQITPEYFDKNIGYDKIQTDALVKAKTRFKELPKSTRRKLNIAGYGQGVSSAILGIGEFAGTVVVNMGMAVSDEKGVFEKRRFKFGGTLGKIRNYPATQSTVGFLESPGGYLKQKGTAPETLGQATVIVPLAYQGIKSIVSNIKTFGFTGGITESVSAISPLRIKSGIYAQPITKDTTFTNIKSIKGTTKGVTTRVYSGSSGSVKLYGVEKSAIIKGKTVGGGYTVTRTPYLEIRGGGTFVTQGIRTTTNPYVFGSGGAGAVYKAKGFGFYNQILTSSLKGGTSTIITSKGATAYISPKGSSYYSDLTKAYRITGGSASRNVRTGVKDFISGKATPQYKIIYGRQNINYYSGKATSKDFIYGPSGKYKLTPQLAGKEYDLNAILRAGGDKGYSSFKGGGGSYKSGAGLKSIYKFGTGGISAVVPITTPIIIPKSSKTILLLTPPKTKVPTKTQTYAPQTQIISLKQFQETTPKITTINIITSKFDTRRKSGGAGRSIQIPIQQPIQKSITTPIQKLKLIPVMKIPIPFSTPTAFTYGSPEVSSFTPYNVPTPFPFLLGGGGGLSLDIGRVRSKRTPTKYTPSFKALFFKIRGKAPKGIATGIRFRPIIPGFSFSRKRKRIIRVRRIRI